MEKIKKIMKESDNRYIVSGTIWVEEEAVNFSYSMTWRIINPGYLI